MPPRTAHSANLARTTAAFRSGHPVTDADLAQPTVAPVDLARPSPAIDDLTGVHARLDDHAAQLDDHSSRLAALESKRDDLSGTN